MRIPSNNDRLPPLKLSVVVFAPLPSSNAHKMKTYLFLVSAYTFQLVFQVPSICSKFHISAQNYLRAVRTSIFMISALWSCLIYPYYHLLGKLINAVHPSVEFCTGVILQKKNTMALCFGHLKSKCRQIWAKSDNRIPKGRIPPDCALSAILGPQAKFKLPLSVFLLNLIGNSCVLIARLV